jgi:hypothetical protein
MIRLLVAAEDAIGFRLVKHLTDQLCREVEWIRDAEIGDFRCWLNHEGADYLPLKSVKQLAKTWNVRSFEKFDGAVGAEDRLLVRKLIRVVELIYPEIHVLVVARDLDRRERRLGFAQGRPENLPFEVVGALAEPEFEAWLIAAWSPGSEAELERHRNLRKQLGFDPITQSEQLTSTSGSKRDAKVVLQALAGTAEAGEERWRTIPVADLAAVGERNGMQQFLLDLRPVLRRLLGAHLP